MASYTLDLTAGNLGVYAKTLAANTEDTVTVTRARASDVVALELYTDGSSPVYFTTDGTAASVAGASTMELPAIPSARPLVVPVGSTKVRLISAGTPKYSLSVQG